MVPFRQTQFSYWILILLPLFFVFIFLPVDPQERTVALIFGLTGPALLFLLFYKMTVSVDDEAVVIRFGAGLIKKRVLIKDVRECRTVKSTFWMGWGIRLITNGWLFNTWGYDAVELKFKNRSAVIWVGSPNSAALKQAVDARISS